MFGHKSGCGHWGKGHGMKGDDWKEEYEKMSNPEKKEMLEKKIEHLKEKIDWAQSELEKIKE